MATINFYLDKPNRKKEHPIFLVFQHKGKKFKYFTKEKIFLKAWDNINQRVKKNFSGCEEINYTLTTLSDLIKKIE